MLGSNFIRNNIQTRIDYNIVSAVMEAQRKEYKEVKST